MKVAYLNYILTDSLLGVTNKIKAQAHAAKEQSLDIDFFIFNKDKDYKADNLIFLRLPKRKHREYILFKYDLINEYSNILSRYDYIVLRYMEMDFSSNRFINKFKDRLVTEHHTKEITEILTTKKYSSYIRAFIEYLRGPRFLRSVKALIGVTEEIRGHEINRIGIQKSSTVISNGVYVNEIPFTRFKKFDGKELNMIFVASRFAPWHGLEYLIDALRKYKGKVKVNLHLVGQVTLKQMSKIQSVNSKFIEVIYHGCKSGRDLNSIFAISNIAVSTIAIFKNGMAEACPLKTREYVARGIPFIYGYKDTDLSGNEDFALNIDARNFSIEGVIEFAKHITACGNDISDYMRDFAIKRLDWRIKVNQMYDFLRTLTP